MTYSEQDCIDALQKAAERLGETPSQRQYEELGLSPSISFIENKAFDSWNDAKDAARLETLDAGSRNYGPKTKNVVESDVDTPDFDDSKLNNFISGLIAGEASFSEHIRDTGSRRYRFEIQMSERDSELLHLVKNYLEVGNLYECEFEEENWDDTVDYSVQRADKLVHVIIPFIEKVGLRNSYKAKQYEEWKESIYKYYDLE